MVWPTLGRAWTNGDVGKERKIYLFIYKTFLERSKVPPLVIHVCNPKCPIFWSMGYIRHQMGSLSYCHLSLRTHSLGGVMVYCQLRQVRRWAYHHMSGIHPIIMMWRPKVWFHMARHVSKGGVKLTSLRRTRNHDQSKSINYERKGSTNSCRHPIIMMWRPKMGFHMARHVSNGGVKSTSLCKICNHDQLMSMNYEKKGSTQSHIVKLRKYNTYS